MTSPTNDRTALEHPLCSQCGGNGVIKIPGGISECPRCRGICYEPSHAKDAEITALREQVAQLTQERDELIVSVHNLDRINAMVRERAEHAEARLTALEAFAVELNDAAEDYRIHSEIVLTDDMSSAVRLINARNAMREALAASPAGAQTPERDWPEHVCGCGTVMICPDIGCDKNKLPERDASLAADAGLIARLEEVAGEMREYAELVRDRVPFSLGIPTYERWAEACEAATALRRGAAKP